MRCCRPLLVVALALPCTVRAEGSFFVAGLAARESAQRGEARVLTTTLRAILEREGLLAELPGAGAVSAEDARRDSVEVEKLIKRARDAYDELDHKACIQAVSDAQQKHDRSVAYHRSMTTMADGLLLMAQSLEKSGQARKARPLYLQVASRWPDHRPDPNAFPPSVGEAMQRARAEVEGAGGVTLSVESTPVGALVFVDGVERGQTPLSLRVGRTRHFVRLETEGTSRTVEVNLEGNGNPRVAVEMEHPAAQASEKLLAALAEKRPEPQLRKAAVSVGKRSGATGVLAGVVLPGRRVVLGRFDAPQGALSRVVETRVGADDADEALAGLVRSLTGGAGPADDGAARAHLLGGGAAAPRETAKPEEPRTVDASPRPEEHDGNRGRGPLAYAPLGLLAIIPAAGVVLLALVGAGAVGAGTFAYLYLNPPNPNGTDVSVDGTALTR